MKQLVYIFLGIASFCTVFAQGPSTSLLPNQQMLESTLIFASEVSGGVGTMFLTDYKGKNYAVTARHVLGGSKVKNGSKHRIKIDTGSILSVEATVYVSSDTTIDAAILTFPEQALFTHRIPIGMKFYTYVGQDVIFLGYPLQLASFVNGRPLPLVKRATLSGYEGGPTEPRATGFLLDGINNEGFSGGPVIATNSDSEHSFVIGIIKGYRFQEQDIYVGKTKEKSEFIYRANTGIIYSVPMYIIIEIINGIS